MLEPLHSDGLASLPGIAHGFFTRHGGGSRGIYASLNCGHGSKDDQAAVRENRARVGSHLAARDLVTANQVHSATAIIVDKAWSPGQRPRADAMVSATPGLALGVLSADCAPVLFADRQAGVIGAAHAGWRGAIGGILEAAVATMRQLGAKIERMRAAVGPCIGPAAYEVGFDFEQQFLQHSLENQRFFTRPDAGARPRFDLAGYIEDRLARQGISAQRITACTYAQHQDFFSYRRSQALKEPDYGRQISAIVLT